MPSNKMYDRLCYPKSFSGNANRTFEDTQATAGDYYHIPEARFSEAVCEYNFEWGLKAIKHLGIQKWLQPRKWGISLKIRIFIKIKKRYFSGSSIICSWKFSPLLMTVLAKILSRGAFEKQISWFSWKVLKQLWICYQVLVLFPETPWGFSSVLLLWVYIICFWYHFLIVYWVIGSNFWVLNVCFCEQF